MTNKQGYCVVSIAPLRAENSDTSEIVSQLLFGELIEIHSIDFPWAKVTTLSDGYTGYIDHKHARLLSEKEVRRWTEGLTYLSEREVQLNTPWGKQWICRGSFIPENELSFQIGEDQFSFSEIPSVNSLNAFELAEEYLNTSYLWGGKSPYGIDCSGITQIIYRFFGINLPRDAYEQADLGETIEFSECELGDLAFFSNASGKVTHVGILNGSGHIIHANGCVRKDRFTPEGIVHSISGELTHTLTSIKRV